MIYLVRALASMLPPIFIGVYSGIFMNCLLDGNRVGAAFSFGIAVAAIITYYGKTDRECTRI